MIRTNKNRLFFSLLLLFFVIFISSFLVLNSCGLFELPTIGFCRKRLNQKILRQSLNLGTKFILNNQKPAGNFNYEYDWIKKSFTPGDSEVRQAGAMWGLALIYGDCRCRGIGESVEKAMSFFEKHSKTTSDGARYVIYPGSRTGRIGTVALCALTYIDYLRTAKSVQTLEKISHYQKVLDEYIMFLINARTSEGLWHQSYDISNGKAYGNSSPYFDGESLLALTKAAKYMEKHDLIPIIIDSANAGYKKNIQEALKKDPDSKITKGYYQWSSMAFFELATSNWEDTKKYGNYVIELADWMIDIHRTLQRTRNTGYAYEGIIHAYRLALLYNDKKHVKKFARVIDAGLKKLTSWQVGSPIANSFIKKNNVNDPKAIGGVQNHRKEAPLRIDVTQHQMHAVILALRYVYED